MRPHYNNWFCPRLITYGPNLIDPISKEIEKRKREKLAMSREENKKRKDLPQTFACLRFAHIIHDQIQSVGGEEESVR